MGSLVPPTRELRTLAQCPQLAISEVDDDPAIRTKYRPFLLDAEVEATDWISQLELETAITMAEENLARTQSRLKVLVLYGSLRKRYQPSTIA
jgi:arsenic resistance protein ArsH